MNHFFVVPAVNDRIKHFLVALKQTQFFQKPHVPVTVNRNGRRDESHFVMPVILNVIGGLEQSVEDSLRDKNVLVHLENKFRPLVEHDCQVLNKRYIVLHRAQI